MRKSFGALTSPCAAIVNALKRTCGLVVTRATGNPLKTTMSGSAREMRRTVRTGSTFRVVRPTVKQLHSDDDTGRSARTRARQDGERYDGSPPYLRGGPDAAPRPPLRGGRRPLGLSRAVPRPRPGPDARRSSTPRPR